MHWIIRSFFVIIIIGNYLILIINTWNNGIRKNFKGKKCLIIVINQ
jgi:hypothetical protein